MPYRLTCVLACALSIAFAALLVTLTACASSKPSGNGDGDVRTQRALGARRHADGGFGGNGAVRAQGLVRHVQLRALDVIRVGDDAADVHVARSCERRELCAHEPACARLCGCEGQSPSAA